MREGRRKGEKEGGRNGHQFEKMPRWTCHRGKKKEEYEEINFFKKYLFLNEFQTPKYFFKLSIGITLTLSGIDFGLFPK